MEQVKNDLYQQAMAEEDYIQLLNTRMKVCELPDLAYYPCPGSICQRVLSQDNIIDE